MTLWTSPTSTLSLASEAQPISSLAVFPAGARSAKLGPESGISPGLTVTPPPEPPPSTSPSPDPAPTVTVTSTAPPTTSPDSVKLDAEQFLGLSSGLVLVVMLLAALLIAQMKRP